MNDKNMGLGQVKIQDLQRKEINTLITLDGSDENIVIRNPNSEEIADLIAYVDEGVITVDIKDSGECVITIEGKEVVKKIFPLLTNINLSELTDAEVDAIIEDPSIELLKARVIVEKIVTDTIGYYFDMLNSKISGEQSMAKLVGLLGTIPKALLELGQKGLNINDLSEEEKEEILKEDEKVVDIKSKDKK